MEENRRILIFEKEEKWAKYVFQSLHLTVVRVLGSRQRYEKISLYFESFGKSGPVFEKVNQRVGNRFEDSVMSREGIKHPRTSVTKHGCQLDDFHINGA